jgi:hypothetical protein
VKGNFSPAALNREENNTSQEGSVDDILSEASEHNLDFATPKKHDSHPMSRERMPHAMKYDSIEHYVPPDMCQHPMKESLIRKQREEVMRKFGYMKPSYAADLPSRGSREEIFSPLVPEEVNIAQFLPAIHNLIIIFIFRFTIMMIFSLNHLEGAQQWVSSSLGVNSHPSPISLLTIQTILLIQKNCFLGSVHITVCHLPVPLLPSRPSHGLYYTLKHLETLC